MTFSTRMGTGIATLLALGAVALYGCVSVDPGAPAPAPEGPSAEAAQALTGWQCACEASSEYMAAVSLSQGSALGCETGIAYRCGKIPWGTRGNFTMCSDRPECPPGWYAVARQSGPYYCGGILGSTGCSPIPYPSGTYLTCDAACALGFTQTNAAEGTPSCDFDTRLTCQR